MKTFNVKFTALTEMVADIEVTAETPEDARRIAERDLEESDFDLPDGGGDGTIQDSWEFWEVRAGDDIVLERDPLREPSIPAGMVAHAAALDELRQLAADANASELTEDAAAPERWSAAIVAAKEAMALLASLVPFAESHCEDWESGLEDGTYEDRAGMEKLRETVTLAHLLIGKPS